MRITSILLIATLSFSACRPRDDESPSSSKAESSEVPQTAQDRPDIALSLVRVNSTRQSWNVWQPWEKNPPERRRGLAALVGPMQVVTTAELVANATYLEFESADGSRFTPARVVVADYESNLAMLEPISPSEGEAFFDGMQPLPIARPPRIGDSVQVVQLEDHGQPIFTDGLLQSVTVTSNLLPRHGFLTYLIKASMRSSSSSYTLPILHENGLAGVLLAYNSDDQLCDGVSTDILSRFLADAADGDYLGFPGLGISTSRTEDPSFRDWLGLTEDQGGVYISSVRDGGVAEKAGVLVGDVLLTLDGIPIDRRGYYEHPAYGSLSLGHLIRGEKSLGDVVELGLLRNREPIELQVTLEREGDEPLVPEQMFDRAPNYHVKGGLLFQELSRPLLESFGNEWRSVAPLNLLDAFQNPENYRDKMRRVVFLSGTIPTPATIGYESLRNLIVKRVNGTDIRDLKDLVRAFEDHDGDLHSIEFADDGLTIYLDDTTSTLVDSDLLQRGISRLSRVD
ncbi:MAG: PDZ domain-containing protein [Luteolibacter sp.]